jgi:hypothetical protein
MKNGYVCLNGNEPVFPKPSSKEWDLLLKSAKVGVVTKGLVKKKFLLFFYFYFYFYF